MRLGISVIINIYPEVCRYWAVGVRFRVAAHEVVVVVYSHTRTHIHNNTTNNNNKGGMNGYDNCVRATGRGMMEKLMY